MNEPPSRAAMRHLTYVLTALVTVAAGIAVVGQMKSMKRKFEREVGAAGLPTRPPAGGGVVTDADIERFPAAVQRYLRFMGVVGRPRDWSFRAHMTGRFRTKPDQSWMAMQAWQYDCQPEMARIFHVRVRFFGVVPVLGRDTFLAGQGRMLIRPLDLFTADDVTGAEVDISELVTYLNDAVLLAPSFLLGPETRWSPVDADSFDVSLTRQDRTVTGRVFLDRQGAPRDFSTTDRFVQNPYDTTRPPPLIRARWTTPVDGWQVVDGRRLPTTGRAIWHLPRGEFTYVEMTFRPNDIAFNVPPGE